LFSGWGRAGEGSVHETWRIASYTDIRDEQFHRTKHRDSRFFGWLITPRRVNFDAKPNPAGSSLQDDCGRREMRIACMVRWGTVTTVADCSASAPTCLQLPSNPSSQDT
jgi:hypothetical protein